MSPRLLFDEKLAARRAVRVLSDFFASGRAIDAFLRDFPTVRRDPIRATLALALDSLEHSSRRREKFGRPVAPFSARWPDGRDAHSAHHCTGFAAVTAENRESEFK